MKQKLKGYWNKTESLRKSMPNFFKQSMFGTSSSSSNEPSEQNLSISQHINKAFLKYKEFRYLHKKFKIQPAYLVYILIICFLFIVIGFFDKYLTILIGTCYPLYVSLKTLTLKLGEEKPDGQGYYTEDDQKKDAIQWLSYWVVYACFINFECIFGKMLKDIKFYFPIKVIFLIFCYLPQFRLSWWIYTHVISKVFNKYEKIIVDFLNKVIKQITEDNNNNNNNNKIKNVKVEKVKKKRKRSMNDSIYSAKTQDDDDNDDDDLCNTEQ